ncbi:MAG: PilZ domain-containing protein [Pseudomonadota bacterium]
MAHAAVNTVQPNDSAKTGSRYLTDYQEIVDLLKQLRDLRCTLTLSFDKKSPGYTAKLLDIHDGHFLIEDISPRDGNARLKAGEPFTISARAHGIFAFFNETTIYQADAERGLPFFLVELPQSLLVQQRRRDPRYQIPVTVATRRSVIALHRNGEPEPLLGSILDISAGGCRAEFANSTLPQLQKDESFEHCTLNISDMLELSSEATIRHTTTDQVSRNLVCGLELTKMHVTDRRRLEHFIQIIAKNA